MICPGLSGNRRLIPSKKNQKKSPIKKNRHPQKFIATRYYKLLRSKLTIVFRGKPHVLLHHELYIEILPYCIKLLRYSNYSTTIDDGLPLQKLRVRSLLLREARHGFP